ARSPTHGRSGRLGATMAVTPMAMRPQATDWASWRACCLSISMGVERSSERRAALLALVGLVTQLRFPLAHGLAAFGEGGADVGGRAPGRRLRPLGRPGRHLRWRVALHQLLDAPLRPHRGTGADAHPHEDPAEPLQHAVTPFSRRSSPAG